MPIVISTEAKRSGEILSKKTVFQFAHTISFYASGNF